MRAGTCPLCGTGLTTICSDIEVEAAIQRAEPHTTLTCVEDAIEIIGDRDSTMRDAETTPCCGGLVVWVISAEGSWPSIDVGRTLLPGVDYGLEVVAP